jgi:thiamine phosphate synthase YjbQ (UPF0047 family)
MKTALIGSSISVPITDGDLNLGTWQGRLTYYSFPSQTQSVVDEGIYLTEFRHVAHSRRIVATVL